MNILIVGLGSIAQKHIKAIQSLDVEANMYALRSNKKSEQHEGITNIFDLENAKIKFDFAIISNPTQQHFECIKLLAEKKINLFIEKPPIHTLDNAQVLIDFIQKNEIKNYVACNLRFHPCIQFIKQFLVQNTNQINEVNIYCGSYLPDWRKGVDFRKIYSAIPELGGGVHLDLFHEIDYTHHLFGKPNNVFSIKRNVSSLNIEAIDYANYILEYQKFTTNIVLNYYRKDSKRTIEIVLEDQTILVDLIKCKITNNLGETLFETGNFDISLTYKTQMENFVNYLCKDINFLNTFASSIEVLKTCLNND